MLREEFINKFCAFIKQRSNLWLPEESTEIDFLTNIKRNIIDHEVEIKKTLRNPHETDHGSWP